MTSFPDSPTPSEPAPGGGGANGARTPIRVLVVDDNEEMRAVLATALGGFSDIKLVAAAADCATARRLIATHRPEVLLLDLQLPDGHGWTLLEQLRDTGELPATLILSGCDELVFAERILRAGARGYLMKDQPIAAIAQGVRDVAAGRFVASSRVLSDLAASALGAARGPGQADALGSLSDREVLVHSLLAEKLRNKEIAVRLDMSEKTVSTYKRRLTGKLKPPG